MSNSLYLAHHGVKGQKHGVRQWQNPDGSLTAAGRIHYGVGAARKAVGKVGNAIRKKVKPTNAELNARIRKEKSKILNKQKKAELKRLKKTGKIEDPTKNSPHKRYKDLTDTDVQNKINRLKKEAELAELEALQHMSPMRRKLITSLQDGLKEGVKTATSNAIKDTGKKITDELLGKGGGKNNNNGGGKKKKNNNNNNGNNGGGKKNSNSNSNNNNGNNGVKKKKNQGQKWGSSTSLTERMLDSKLERQQTQFRTRAKRRAISANATALKTSKQRERAERRMFQKNEARERKAADERLEKALEKEHKRDEQFRKRMKKQFG